MDYLKEIQKQTGGTIKLRNASNVNFEQVSRRGLAIPNYQQFKIAIDDYGTKCEIQVNVNTEFALSVNMPNMFFFYDKVLNVEDISYKLYFKEEYLNLLDQERFKKFCKSLDALLRKIGTKADESINIWIGRIDFALHTNRDIKPVLDNIIDFIHDNPDIFFKKEKKPRINVANIPDNLKPLLPLLKKFSISDDTERQELVEKMTEKKKGELINTVSPYMKEINHFLDSFKDGPVTEEATMIGSLAELVSELQVNG